MLDSPQTELETLLDSMEADLVSGDADAYAAHCQRFGPLCVQFGQFEQKNATVPVQHLRWLQQRIQVQRENMARRAGQVDMALNVLLPPQEAQMYGPKAKAGSRRASRTSVVAK